MYWNSSALWGLIGLIGGFFISLFFYQLNNNNKSKKLIFNIRSTTLVSQELSNYKNIVIFYTDKVVETLINSTITFRNGGKDIVEATDITPSDPIIISTTNKFFLDENDECEIITSSPKTKVTISKVNDSAIELSFDLLPRESTITLVLLHDGILSCKGSLKKSSIVEIRDQEKFYKEKRSDTNTLVNSIVFLLTVIFATAINYGRCVVQGIAKHQYVDDSFIVIIILLSILTMFLLLLYLLIRKD